MNETSRPRATLALRYAESDVDLLACFPVMRYGMLARGLHFSMAINP